MHQLLAVHPDTKTAVMLDQRHARAVRRLGFGEGDVGFHGLKKTEKLTTKPH